MNETNRAPSYTPSRLLSPTVLLGVGAFLAVIPALLAPAADREIWSPNWALTSGDYGLLLLGLSVILVGLALARVGRGPDRKPPGIPGFIGKPSDIRALSRSVSVLYGLFLVGYLVWTISAIGRGLTLSLAVATLTGQPGANYLARATLTTIPGLSTLTEVGPVLIAALTYLGRCGVRRRKMFWSVLLISALRSFVNSERVSLIEIVIPVAIVLALTSADLHDAESSEQPRRTKPHLREALRRKQRRVRLAALTIPFLVYGFFTVSERTRSWASHYQYYAHRGLFTFSFYRIWAYYATATNNGALYGHIFAAQLHFPQLTLGAITNAPIVSEFLRLMNVKTDYSGDWATFLSQNANPEFNNVSTILPVIAEIGLVPALALFFLWGFMYGRVFRKLEQGSALALVAYASLAIALVEIPRYPYLLSGRAVPAVLALVIIYRYRARTEQEEPQEFSSDEGLRVDARRT